LDETQPEEITPEEPAQGKPKVVKKAAWTSVGITLKTEKLEALDRIADSENVSRNSLLRIAVRLLLEQDANGDLVLPESAIGKRSLKLD
jgi:hypothetical protein